MGKGEMASNIVQFGPTLFPIPSSSVVATAGSSANSASSTGKDSDRSEQQQQQQKKEKEKEKENEDKVSDSVDFPHIYTFYIDITLTDSYMLAPTIEDQGCFCSSCRCCRCGCSRPI